MEFHGWKREDSLDEAERRGESRAMGGEEKVVVYRRAREIIVSLDEEQGRKGESWVEGKRKERKTEELRRWLGVGRGE